MNNIEKLFTREEDFSDWLSNNLHKLEPLINYKLKKISTEKEIKGKFLDILAENQEGKKIAIENQFGISNFKHLGQFISYSVSEKVEEGIWIAERFHPIHVDVLTWLNNINSSIKFTSISVLFPETNRIEDRDKIEFKKPILFNEVNVGDILDARNREKVKIDNTLKNLIEIYNEEKSKHKIKSKAVRKGLITGSFIHWVYDRNRNQYENYFPLKVRSKNDFK